MPKNAFFFFLIGPKLFHSYFLHLSSHWEMELFQRKPPPLIPSSTRHRDRRREDIAFPSSNSSPFAINFYSVTKNRLMVPDVSTSHPMRAKPDKSRKTKGRGERAPVSLRPIAAVSTASGVVCRRSGRREVE